MARGPSGTFTNDTVVKWIGGLLQGGALQPGDAVPLLMASLGLDAATTVGGAAFSRLKEQFDPDGDSNHKLLSLAYQAKWRAVHTVTREFLDDADIAQADIDRPRFEKLLKDVDGWAKADPGTALDSRNDTKQRSPAGLNAGQRAVKAFREAVATFSGRDGANPFVYSETDRNLMRDMHVWLSREAQNQPGDSAANAEMMAAKAAEMLEGVIRDIWNRSFATQAGSGKADALKEYPGGFDVYVDALSDPHTGWFPTMLVELKKRVAENNLDAHRVLTTLVSEIRFELGAIAGDVKDIRKAVMPRLNLQTLPPWESGKLKPFTPFMFRQRATKVLGRKTEEAALQAFLKDDRAFLWWQVAGPGGAGKSRLALDLVDRIKGDWHAGFLESEDLPQLADDTLTFDRPTLIVIDYVAAPGKADMFANATRKLFRRFGTQEIAPDRPPVRVLVLERAGYGATDNADGQLQADWFQQLNEDQQHDLAECWFADAALKLERLDDPTMIAIANSWRKGTDKDDLTEDQEEHLITALKGKEKDAARSRAWRPLFAMMYADRIDRMKPGNFGATNIEELLRGALNSEKEKDWGGKNPTIPAVNLACLATIVGNLPVETDVIELDDFYTDEDLDLLRDAWMVLGQRVVDPSIADRSAAPAPLTARTPDLMGEYMIIDMLERHYRPGLQAVRGGAERVERLMTDAWRLDSDATMAFLIRMVQDFEHHPVTEALTQALSAVDPETLPLDNDREFALRTAASFGWDSMVAKLLSEDDSPEFIRSVNSNGNYALIFAAYFGHLSIVKRLIEEDPAVEHVCLPGQYGVFPLYWASLQGHLNVVDSLLRDDIAEAQVLMKADAGAFPLYVAAENGHLNVVERLLKIGDEEAHALMTTDGGFFPLFVAAHKGHLEVVERLLQVGDPEAHARMTTDEGAFPLCVAANNGHLDVVERLLKIGDEETHALMRTDEGFFPLYVAAENGHLDLVERLLQVGDPEAHALTKTDGGFFPLYIAARNGHLNVVERLLQVGDEEAHARMTTDEGAFPLCVAANNGHLDVVERLLKIGDEAAHALMRTDEGFFPLYVAAENGHLNVVERLLQVGDPEAHALTKTDGGFFPLYIAARNGYLDVLEALIAANPSKDHLELVVQSNSLFPLISAVGNGNADCAAALVKAGAHVNQLWERTELPHPATSLDLAIDQDNETMIQLLRDHGGKTAKELGVPGAE